MKQMFFLHGLPRTGNTLLGSILNQNPKIAVTANSPCADMLGEMYMLKHTDIFKNFPDHKSFDNVAKSLFKNYYKDWSADYIIDRAPWGYPINLKFLKEVQKDIVQSFITNLDYKERLVWINENITDSKVIPITEDEL